ncbi:MAG: hypothetical protein ACJ8AO_17865, partial [Gemmatimonadaceae bacterium]
GAGRAGGAGRGAPGDDPRFPTPLPPGATVIPAGGCAAYLATAPLGLVPMDDELRRALVALGIRSAGGLAALAPADVERRWGAEGLAAWRLARGEDRRRPVLARAEARRAAAAELATPAATMEPVLFLVRAALDRLAAELAADGRAAAVVAVTLTLDDGRGHLPAGGVPHTVTREIKLARPLARVAPLFERCRALLDRWPLTAPVCGVAVEITATAPASGEQGGLFDLAWRDPAAVDAALERLRAELGPNVVVRPVARDEHRPERAGAWVEEGEPAAGTEGAGPEVDGAAPAAAAPAAPAAPAALRLLEAPEAVEVEPGVAPGDLAEAADPVAAGSPGAMRWRGRRVVLERAVGPERLSGDWWRDGFRRDYWRCAGDGATEFLLYRAEDGRWFLHGWYD